MPRDDKKSKRLIALAWTEYGRSRKRSTGETDRERAEKNEAKKAAIA